jgi:hypothetical protein
MERRKKVSNLLDGFIDIILYSSLAVEHFNRESSTWNGEHWTTSEES